MLQFDLRELASGPVDTAAQLGAEDPLFEGLGVALTGPVRVSGRLQAAGAGRFYWKGSLRAQVGGECRRCLAPVPLTVTADIRALFTEDPDAQEDPDSYPLAHDATRSISGPRCARSCCSPCRRGWCAGRVAAGCARAVAKT